MALVHIVKTTANVEKHFPENVNGKLEIVLADGTVKELVLTDG